MAEHNASASAYADYTPLQRLALLSWWLARGEVVTLDKAAVVLGGTRDAAHAQLTDLIAVIPIAAEHGRWLRVTTSPAQQPPVTVDEQAALLAWLLALGGVLSNTDAGALIGTGSRQARRLLDKLALVLLPCTMPRGCGAHATTGPRTRPSRGAASTAAGVEVLTTGTLRGAPVLWCASCAGVYRALKGAR
jgi:hypothetical protein